MVGVIGATRSLPANPPSELIKSLKRAGEAISGVLGHDAGGGRR
jgi:hypothetical protein